MRPLGAPGWAAQAQRRRVDRVEPSDGVQDQTPTAGGLVAGVNAALAWQQQVMQLARAVRIATGDPMTTEMISVLARSLSSLNAHMLPGRQVQLAARRGAAGTWRLSSSCRSSECSSTPSSSA